MEAEKKKVVVLGGGTGTYQILTGLKKYPVDITAVVSMCDSGGSTGRLRKELGILPPGDVRKAIIALSDLPFAYKTLEELFDFRFKKGNVLRGHSVGNILLAALTQITGSMDKAVEEAARILNTSGSIFPITLDKSNLVAILEDGTRIFGETNIDMRNVKLEVPINKVYLSPSANIYSKASHAIREADLVVMSPGDLYSSIIATLLVNGVTQAIKSSKGRMAIFVNLVTKRGETDGYTANDHVEKICEYLSDALPKLSWVFVNKKINHKEKKIKKWYKRYGSQPVVNDLRKHGNDFQIIEKDFLSKTTFFRHDSEKIARAIMKIL